MPGAYLLSLMAPATIVTPSTEDAAYPKTNLYDRIAAKVFRCTSPTSLTILLDFGAPITANSIALVNHNLTSSATLSLKADAGNPPSTVVATPAYRENDIWKSFESTSAWYWLLEITDSNLANIQIGQLLLGARVALPRARRIGDSYRSTTRNTGIQSETYGGVKWNYHLYDRKEFNPSFRVVGAELDTLGTLHQSAYGDVRPFLYIPDSSLADCYYVRKEQSFEPTEIDKSGGGIVYDYQMTLTEESRGLEVLA
jgi:hypothetical protein